MVEVPKGRFATFLGNAKGALGDMFGKDRRGIVRGKSKDRREKLVEMAPIGEASGSDDILVERRLPQEHVRVGYRGPTGINTEDPWYKGVAQLFPTFGKKKIQPQDSASLIELEAIESPRSVKGKSKSKSKGIRARVGVGLRMSDLAVEEAARKRGAAAVAEDAARSGFLPGGIPGTSVSRRVGRVKSTGKKTKKKHGRGTSSGSDKAELLGIMARSSSRNSIKAAPVRFRVAAPAAAAASVVRSRIAPSIAGPAPVVAASVARPASRRRSASASASPWSSSSSSAKRKKARKIKVVIRPAGAGAGAAAAPIPVLFPPP
jgi:hypothetical protein